MFIQKRIKDLFLTIWFFFQVHSGITKQQTKGEAISLTPFYHSHSLQRHLRYQPGDRCRELTSANNQWPYSNLEYMVFEHKSLTTMLREIESCETSMMISIMSNINDGTISAKVPLEIFDRVLNHYVKCRNYI